MSNGADMDQNAGTRYGDFYSRESPIYDQRRYSTSYGKVFSHLHLAALDAALAGMPKGSTVLDIGCGTGHASRLMLKRGMRVTGFDLNRRMIEQSPDVLNNPAFDFVEGNAFDMEFADAEFDAITATRFFHLFDREEQLNLITELTRVAAIGARIVVDFDSHSSQLALWPILTLYNIVRYRRFRPDTNYNTIASALGLHELAGLTVLGWKPIGGYHLLLPALFSHDIALRIGKWQQARLVGRVFGEQFLIVSIRS